MDKFVEYLAGPEDRKYLDRVAKNYSAIASEERVAEYSPELCYSFSSEELATIRNLPVTPGSVVVPSGILTDHVVYALCFYQSTDFSDVLMTLQQAVLVAWSMYRKQQRPIIDSDFKIASMAIRSLLQKQDHSLLGELKKIGTGLNTFEQINESFGLLADWLDAECSHKNKKNIAGYLRQSHLLWESAAGAQVTRRQGVSRLGKASNFQKRVGVYGFSDIASNSALYQLKLEDHLTADIFAIANKPEGSFADEIASSGAELIEDNESIEFQFVESRVTDHFASTFNLKKAEIGRTNAIRRQNHFPHSSLQRLNSAEQDQLKAWLESENIDASIRLAVLVSLSLSKNIDELREFNVVDHEADISKTSRLGFIKSINRFYCRTYKPHYELPDDNSLESLQQSIKQRYVLIQPYFVAADMPCNLSTGGQPFKDTDDESIKNELSKLGNRFTLASIANHRALELAGRYGAAVATAIFSKPLPSSLSRQYYLRLNQAQVDQYLHQTPVQSVHCDESNGFGARYVPTINYARSLLADLKNVVPSIKHASSLADAVAYHNAVTCLHFVAQSYLTATRAVTSAFIFADDIVEIDDVVFAIVSDKDNEYQSNTRTIPVSPACKRIATSYEHHIKTMQSRGIVLTNSALWLLGFEDGELKHHIAKPSQVMQELNKLLTRPLLPLNSNRKYLRTTLTQRGLAEDIVDTLLGHASRGQSVMDSFSTTSFKQHYLVLVEQLEIIAIELGIKDGWL